MAEALISIVVQRLGNALLEEALFLKAVPGQFERLKDELISIQAFLEAADRKRYDDPTILNWVADVRDIAYDVDDIINLFFLKVGSKDRGVVDISKKMKAYKDYKIGKAIQDIFTKIEKIGERRQRYVIEITSGRREEESSSSSNEIWLRRSYPSTEDHNIIGLGEATNKLVEELMKEGGGRRVVSICGMGGLGKTTLAKRVYNHNSVRNHFDCCAWTFISQECRPNNVLQEILRQVSNLSADEREKITEVQLVEKLTGILQEKRYLVVLDDLWTEDAWDMLKSAFPSGRNGSKLILTSRSTNVASHADPQGFRYNPQFLNEDEAWDLICKIACPEDDVGAGLNVSGNMETCKREIVKKYGVEIVKKCGGLPSAIVARGVQVRKKTLNESKTTSKDIGQADVLRELALSYRDLPFHLKPLYLYLGLFPEDHQIVIKDVIRMWIAEGMVISKQGSGLTMEETGELYVEELIRRSMIQVGSRTKSGRVRTCQLHDTMRDLIILKASGENFFQIIRNDFPSFPMAGSKLRRCAIYLEKERYAFSPHIVPIIRSVLFFQGFSIDPSILENAHKDFKLIRVLHFSSVLGSSEFLDLPVGFFGEVSKLINLKYLYFRGLNVHQVPESIGNLVFLETLDVRCNRGVRLPDVIWKMSRLRHLYMDGNTEIIGWRLRLDTLEQLRTLVGKPNSWRVEDLAKLTNLRKLKAIRLSYCDTANISSIVDYAVDGLYKLQSLDLETHWVPSLEHLSQNHHLLKLKLEGQMSSWPSNWPSSLVKMSLLGTQIREDPMPTLEKLQNLEYLEFYNWGCERMICSSNGFPRLEHLKLKLFRELRKWIVMKGAMLCLTSLEIDSCYSLEKIPENVKFLTKLKQLHLIYMLRSFAQRVEKGGEDWQTVQHISSITIKET